MYSNLVSRPNRSLDRVAREEILHVSTCRPFCAYSFEDNVPADFAKRKKKTNLHFTDASEHVRLFSTWIASCCLFFFYCLQMDAEGALV